MKWGKPRIGGEVYDLTHLDPMAVSIPPFGDGPKLSARVKFGAHVFTLAWSENYINELKFMDGKTPRCFCPIRYAHSKHLPGIFERSISGRVLFDPQKRLVVLGNPPGVLSPYAIFFRIQAARNERFDLLIDVVSAHEHPQLKAKFGMDFSKLAGIVASGGQIPWPKKRK